MKTALASLSLVFCAVPLVDAQQLKVPAGCRAAENAQSSHNGYADKIVHQKTEAELRLVPPGTFVRGSGKQAQQVTIQSPFYMGKTEVTNGQYRRFVAATGYDGQGDVDSDPDYDLYLRHWREKSAMSTADRFPVVWVSWKNAQAFCKWAGLTLPSEAQWEYTCRATTTTPYYFGADRQAFDQYGWANTSKAQHTHAVAGKLPNTWGFYDMLGNVWEWVEDDFVPGYQGAPTDGSAQRSGALTRTARGGSWSCGTQVCNSNYRYHIAPTNAGADIGFRTVLPIESRRLRTE
jgi:formylglycine-generating enzyme required for sulfatase activity